jgi:RNA polymerase sigma-70 factor (ECF subfamily)
MAERSLDDKGRDEERLHALILRAMRKDDEAFSELYNIKLPHILFFAYRILGNHHDAEETAQDAVIRMYRNIGTLKDPGNFNAWMYRIVTNSCYSVRRGLKNKIVHVDLDENAETEAFLDEDDDFLPQEYAERAELRGRLKKVIEALPEGQKAVILLRYFENMSYGEIASAMDIASNTVGSYLAKGKARIKREMENFVGIAEKRAIKVGALPVLTTVLREQFDEEVTPSVLTRFNEAYGSTLPFKGASQSHVASAAHSAARASAMKSRLFIVILALGGAGAVVAGWLLGPNAPSETPPVQIEAPEAPVVAQEEPAAPQVEYSYSLLLDNDGQCACGHLNPHLIELKVSPELDGTVSWTISKATGSEANTGAVAGTVETEPSGDDGGENENTDDALYDGEGMVVTAPLTELYDAGADGDYALVFVAKEASGRIVRVRQPFHIDTGTVIPGQYG